MNTKYVNNEKLIFTDLEASGLHEGSYPIEVGWSQMDLLPTSMLIKPVDAWTEELWSDEAEQIHGIPRSQLFSEGKDVEVVANLVNQAFENKYVVSDSPSFDGRWLNEIFVAAKISPKFEIVSIEDAWVYCAKISNQPFKDIVEVLRITENISTIYKHTHRAADDALLLAAMCRGIADKDWLQEQYLLHSIKN